MRIGFYNPYFDSLSGGERYVLALASHWSKDNTVDVFWDDSAILAKAQARLHLDLTKIRTVPNVFGEGNVLQKLLVSRKYDLIFFLSDGSVPTSLAKHNILHFQMPFTSVTTSAWKLRRYDAIVCNSSFTKNNLDPVLQNKAIVIYPPVAPIDAGETKKEKVILSVGRFSGFHTAKKQHILLEAFAKGMKAKRFLGWKLILAGGLLPSDEEYFVSLKRLARGLPVDLLPNAAHEALTDYYKCASLYWHAAGYGETDARWMEHFGITTAEAMSAGAVPVVFAAGGQLEIVEDGKNGFLWRTVEELLDKTDQVITNNKTAATLQKNAIDTSNQFSVSRFCKAFDTLLATITL